MLSAEDPGASSEKDVEIKIEDNVLSIQGERKLEKETREENYHRIERAYGSFYRSFTLPNYIDEDKIQAEHENGVVKITMPKKAELKPRKVKIVSPRLKKKKRSSRNGGPETGFLSLGEGDRPDFPGSGPQQHPAAFADGRSCREDIVDEEQHLPVQRSGFSHQDKPP